MSDLTALRRQLKIKSGVAKRLFKEHQTYEKEEVDQKIKLDKFVADGAEAWDIKNAGLMLEENKKLVKDVANRLGAAVQDLRELLVSAKQNPEITQDEEYLKAEEILESVSV
ncbi:hypothetical protein EUX98_g3551 [Antrodiella citrinella]|uniref:Tubulin-specific chaperone A n=1 Tax=Antrodiella citrinella TaxID=2447956 RepID=A0A4S4MW73_9APHY|nr:hypothetical protein EUX98_g3551 [Antrodiella citrinella]